MKAPGPTAVTAWRDTRGAVYVEPSDPVPAGTIATLDLTGITRDSHRLRVRLLRVLRGARFVYIEGGTFGVRRRVRDLLRAAGVRETVLATSGRDRDDDGH